MSGKENKDVVDSVDPIILEEAIFKQTMDESSKKILKDEEEYIKSWREYRGDAPEIKNESLIGLGLSGGGIRSATFCLGVMQALASAKGNLFNKVDYLSTVSGGGYIGSSITWLMNQFERVEDGEVHFPYGFGHESEVDKDDINCKQAKNLRYLREHGNYLTPGGGINTASLIGVFLRGMLSNLVVWVPFFLAIMMLIVGFSKSISKDSDYIKYVEKSYFCQSAEKKQSVQKHHNENFDREGEPNQKHLCKVVKWHPISWFLINTSFILSVLFVFGCAVYSLFTWFFKGKESTSGNFLYALRRNVDKKIGVWIFAIVALLVMGSIPLVAQVFDYEEGLGVALMGILSGIWTYIQSSKNSNDKNGGGLPLGLVATLGSMFFIYGMLFIIFLFAYTLAGGVHGDFHPNFGMIGIVSFIISLILGKFVNLNLVSIHRYYRDRLMESFMPDDIKKIDLDKKIEPSTQANKSRLYEVSEKAKSPYHIINTNLVLVDSDTRRYRMRGGDNFILSPKYCGSNATGWRSSKSFVNGNMTLATAVAISGAAGNPNTGVGGKGVTRNPLVSLLMALFNIRLGYWIPNPKKNQGIQPNHFHSAWYEIIPGIGFAEDCDYLQISDGGHFENNAIYELMRRRCKLIIVCDAGADLEFSFSDFQTSLKRIERDFGARIYFDKDNRWEKMIPSEESQEGGKSVYPPGAKFAEQGYIEGTIIYPEAKEEFDKKREKIKIDRENAKEKEDKKRVEEENKKLLNNWSEPGRGKLIFLKTTMVKGVNFDVKGYKAGNPDFPDQTTADQFFDEEQFEAYRKLGKRIGEDMITGTELDKIMGTVEGKSN